MYDQSNLLKMDSPISNSEESNENKRRCPLRTLVSTLRNYSEQPSPVLLEIQFLNEFSLNEIVPLTLLQPRMFIESMMKIHAECTTIILNNPIHLRKFVYKYNFDDRDEEYIFSNNMPFYIDVMTICFLHIVLTTKVAYASPAVNDLMAIMRRKYYIPFASIYDALLIDETKILISYPSVFIDLLNGFNNKMDFPTSKISYRNILRKWNLTNIFCIPWLALIIPVIESEYKNPLALLLVMTVLLDVCNKPSYVLYQRIVTLYNSEIFPRNLQLMICLNWGIIYKKENIYRFAPYFTKLRKKAIKIISSVKVNDKSVIYTLRQI